MTIARMIFQHVTLLLTFTGVFSLPVLYIDDGLWKDEDLDPIEKSLVRASTRNEWTRSSNPGSIGNNLEDIGNILANQTESLHNEVSVPEEPSERFIRFYTRQANALGNANAVNGGGGGGGGGGTSNALNNVNAISLGGGPANALGNANGISAYRWLPRFSNALSNTNAISLGGGPANALGNANAIGMGGGGWGGGGANALSNTNAISLGRSPANALGNANAVNAGYGGYGGAGGGGGSNALNNVNAISLGGGPANALGNANAVSAYYRSPVDVPNYYSRFNPWY